MLMSYKILKCLWNGCQLFLLFIVFREMNSQASKVFLTSDLCDNRYLCFLVESHQHLRSHSHTEPASMHVFFFKHPCITYYLGELWSFSGQQVFFCCCFYRCVKFIESNDTSQLIFASVTTIPAKDAEPLQVDDDILAYWAFHSLKKTSSFPNNAHDIYKFNSWVN